MPARRVQSCKRGWPQAAIPTAIALLLFAALNGGCPQVTPPDGGTDGTDPPDGTAANARTCVGCHTDTTLLQAVARTEEPLPEDAGEG